MKRNHDTMALCNHEFDSRQLHHLTILPSGPKSADLLFAPSAARVKQRRANRQNRLVVVRVVSELNILRIISD